MDYHSILELDNKKQDEVGIYLAILDEKNSGKLIKKIRLFQIYNRIKMTRILFPDQGSFYRPLSGKKEVKMFFIFVAEN